MLGRKPNTIINSNDPLLRHFMSITLWKKNVVVLFITLGLNPANQTISASKRCLNNLKLHTACGGHKPSGSPKQEEAKPKIICKWYLTHIRIFQQELSQRTRCSQPSAPSPWYAGDVFFRPEKWYHLTALPLADTTGPAVDSEQLIIILMKLSKTMYFSENIWDVTAA